MSYENAPATKMLATYCACCSRPLLDAKSVEIGMGPVCRKKHGYEIDVSPEVRAQANKLVWRIAVEQTGYVVLEMTNQLRQLGFKTLAEIIESRVAPLRLVMVDGALRIKTPFNPAFVDAVRAIPGRKWHKEEKMWSVPYAQRPALWKALRLHYPGALAVGPKGPFTVASAA